MIETLLLKFKQQLTVPDIDAALVAAHALRDAAATEKNMQPIKAVLAREISVLMAARPERYRNATSDFEKYDYSFISHKAGGTSPIVIVVRRNRRFPVVAPIFAEKQGMLHGQKNLNAPAIWMYHDETPCQPAVAAALESFPFREMTTAFAPRTP